MIQRHISDSSIRLALLDLTCCLVLESARVEHMRVVGHEVGAGAGAITRAQSSDRLVSWILSQIHAVDLVAVGAIVVARLERDVLVVEAASTNTIVMTLSHATDPVPDYSVSIVSTCLGPHGPQKIMARVPLMF
jgi:hypothetical protein